MNKLSKQIIVTGRVQGVGYRYSALQMAISLGIKGYIKNLTDGSVLIEAVAEKKQLDLFIQWCKTGPSYAYVDNIEVNDITLKNYSDFRIMH